MLGGAERGPTAPRAPEYRLKPGAFQLPAHAPAVSAAAPARLPNRSVPPMPLAGPLGEVTNPRKARALQQMTSEIATKQLAFGKELLASKTQAARSVEQKKMFQSSWRSDLLHCEVALKELVAEGPHVPPSEGRLATVLSLYDSAVEISAQFSPSLAELMRLFRVEFCRAIYFESSPFAAGDNAEWDASQPPETEGTSASCEQPSSAGPVRNQVAVATAYFKLVENLSRQADRMRSELEEYSQQQNYYLEAQRASELSEKVEVYASEISRLSRERERLLDTIRDIEDQRAAQQEEYKQLASRSEREAHKMAFDNKEMQLQLFQMRKKVKGVSTLTQDAYRQLRESKMAHVQKLFGLSDERSAVLLMAYQLESRLNELLSDFDREIVQSGKTITTRIQRGKLVGDVAAIIEEMQLCEIRYRTLTYLELSQRTQRQAQVASVPVAEAVDSPFRGKSAVPAGAFHKIIEDSMDSFLAYVNVPVQVRGGVVSLADRPLADGGRGSPREAEGPGPQLAAAATSVERQITPSDDDSGSEPGSPLSSPYGRIGGERAASLVGAAMHDTPEEKYPPMMREDSGTTTRSYPMKSRATAAKSLPPKRRTRTVADPNSEDSLSSADGKPDDGGAEERQRWVLRLFASRESNETVHLLQQKRQLAVKARTEAEASFGVKAGAGLSGVESATSHNGTHLLTKDSAFTPKSSAASVVYARAARTPANALMHDLLLRPLLDISSNKFMCGVDVFATDMSGVNVPRLVRTIRAVDPVEAVALPPGTAGIRVKFENRMRHMRMVPLNHPSDPVQLSLTGPQRAQASARASKSSNVNWAAEVPTAAPRGGGGDAGSPLSPADDGYTLIDLMDGRSDSPDSLRGGREKVDLGQKSSRTGLAERGPASSGGWGDDVGAQAYMSWAPMSLYMDEPMAVVDEAVMQHINDGDWRDFRGKQPRSECFDLEFFSPEDRLVSASPGAALSEGSPEGGRAGVVDGTKQPQRGKGELAVFRLNPLSPNRGPQWRLYVTVFGGYRSLVPRVLEWATIDWIMLSACQRFFDRMQQRYDRSLARATHRATSSQMALTLAQRFFRDAFHLSDFQQAVFEELETRYSLPELMGKYLYELLCTLEASAHSSELASRYLECLRGFEPPTRIHLSAYVLFNVNRAWPTVNEDEPVSAEEAAVVLQHVYSSDTNALETDVEDLIVEYKTATRAKTVTLRGMREFLINCLMHDEEPMTLLFLRLLANQSTSQAAMNELDYEVYRNVTRNIWTEAQDEEEGVVRYLVGGCGLNKPRVLRTTDMASVMTSVWSSRKQRKDWFT